MTDTPTPRDGSSHLYYGPGKGKTTAAVGLALRAAGHGFAVSILQFMKGHEEVGEEYGEIELLRTHERIDVRQFPTRHAASVDDLSPDERRRLLSGVETAMETVSDLDVDLVVLDELTLLWELGVVNPPKLVSLFEQRPPATELVVTGRTAPPALVDAAEYVTYMAEIKHPYQQGTTARPGIEY